jgi:hypothetical protein
MAYLAAKYRKHKDAGPYPLTPEQVQLRDTVIRAAKMIDPTFQTEEARGKSRAALAIAVRMVTTVLARDHLNASWWEIAAILGRRNHTIGMENYERWKSGDGRTDVLDHAGKLYGMIGVNQALVAVAGRSGV